MADNNAATALTLQIVTPQGMVEDVSVSMVTLPGIEGDFGVLPGHAPVISVLKPGSVYYEEGGMPRVLVVSGGFAEVSQEKVMVIARTCEKSGDIDLARAQKARTELESALATLPSDDESRPRKEDKLARATARISASQGETPYS